MRWFKRRDRSDWGPSFSVTIILVVLALICWEQIVKVRIPFVRLKRYVMGDCLVCNRVIGHYRYCSLECAAYDGALKDPKKSWVLFGTVHAHPKPHYEAAMHEE